MADATKITENRVSGLVTFPGTSLTAVQFQVANGGIVSITDTVRDRDVGAPYDEEIPNLATISDLTLARVWKTDRDLPIFQEIAPRAGVLYGNAAKVLRDLYGNRSGLLPYLVKLKSVAGPEGDSNGNGKGQLTLVCSCHGLG